MLRVKKRNGTVVNWDSNRIVKAMAGAFNEVQPDRVPNLTVLAESVAENIESEFVRSDKAHVVSIELVHDGVEQVLNDYAYPQVSTAYQSYRDRRDELREKKLDPDPNALANYIHIAKYARHLKKEERREVFEETVNRVHWMHRVRYSIGPEDTSHISDHLRVAMDMVRAKKILPSMRSMQFAGDALLEHNARMYNCAFTHIDRPRVFQEIFYLLLAGCGVGFSVQWRHVDKLPAIARVDNKKVYHHVVEDTIEGWADAVGALMKAFKEGYYVQFGYHKIRPEGAVLKTSGGLAPGHIPLRETLIDMTKVLKAAEGRKLRPIECHDMVCYIAQGVLAGGIRRSSLISLFSPEDTEMLYAKASGNFNPMTGHNDQRMMANNSAVLLRDDSQRDYFERVIRIAQEGFGEPGFFFTEDLDYGTNPCGEIGLNPVLWETYVKRDGKMIPMNGRKTGFSFCNLCEVNVAACYTQDEFIHAVCSAAALGTFQAGYTSFPYLGEVTEKIAERDALLGIGLTGMMDNPRIAFDPSLLQQAVKEAKTVNNIVAGLLGIKSAQRLTTIKPSGTASLELGCVGSGIHPHHAKRYFRRVTANRNEPPAQYFVKVNPHMVEQKPDGDWSLIFPVKAPDDALTVKSMGALEFMEKVFLVYENWVKPGTIELPNSEGLTHNVSCTVTVRDEEVGEVVKAIWKNRDKIAAICFAPYMLDKKFPFAPREEVKTEADETRWRRLIETYRPVDWTKMVESAETVKRRSLEAACSGGTCELD